MTGASASAAIMVLLLVLLANGGCGPRSTTTVRPSGSSVSQPLPLPDLTMQTLQGDTLTLSGLRGKVIIADFWGIICSACVEGLDEYDKSPLVNDPRVQVVAISRDQSPSAVRQFATEHGWNFPVVLETQELRRELLRVERPVLPQVRLIDTQGRLRYQLGPEKANLATIQRLADELLGEAQTPGPASAASE